MTSARSAWRIRHSSVFAADRRSIFAVGAAVLVFGVSIALGPAIASTHSVPNAASDSTPAADWRYVVSPEVRPAPRALTLFERPPEGVTVEAELGSLARFGQFRFGSAGSTRVAIALDERDGDRVDLYVDADRDRKITASDRVEGDGREWRLPLDLLLLDRARSIAVERTIVLRLGESRALLGYANAGYMEGSVEVDGRRLRARRIDRDGDGFFTDDTDALLLDRNDDGGFDPVDEATPYRAILTLDGRRYKVRSNDEATELTFSAIEGAGAVRLAFTGKDGATPDPLDTVVTLTSRDGLTVGLRPGDEPTTVPVGEYRVTNIKLSLPEPGGPRWNYIFSTSGARGEPVWYSVEKDGEIEIDPIGTLDFRTGIDASSRTLRAGTNASFTPRLYTKGGLLVTTCYQGSVEGRYGGPAATVQLRSADGTILGQANSGFA